MKFSFFISILVLLPAFLTGCEPPKDETRMPNYAFVEFEAETVSLEVAIQRAAEDDKKILVDIYTDWCGFCRKMLNETYPTSEVQTALENYYHYVRLDAESNDRVTYMGRTVTKRELAVQLGATGFPTTVFLTSKGEPLGMQPGFIDAPTFERLLVYVAKDAYQTTSFDEFTID
jgi:thioredoxin-related protein